MCAIDAVKLFNGQLCERICPVDEDGNRRCLTRNIVTACCDGDLDGIEKGSAVNAIKLVGVDLACRYCKISNPLVQSKLGGGGTFQGV